MRAWVHTKKGNPAKAGLSLRDDYAEPEPKPNTNEIKVKVHAAALNPVFYKAMSVFPSFVVHKPLVPEADFAGEIVGGNLDGSDFKVGDKVFGQRSADKIIRDGRGTLAQFTIAQSNVLAHKPDNISFSEAAGVPLACNTAFQALVATGGLKKGANQRIFINGGSAGTGSFGIQIAKAYGAYVVTTKSPSSADFVAKLGPDEAVDYRASPLPTQLKEKYASEPFDIIFDAVGTPELYYACPAFLKPDGMYVDIAGKATQKTFVEQLGFAWHLVNRTLRPRWLGGTPRKYKFMMLEADKAGPFLKEAAELLQKGEIKSYIDSEYAFEDAQAAYEKLMSSRAKGKVVVKVIS